MVIKAVISAPFGIFACVRENFGFLQFCFSHLKNMLNAPARFVALGNDGWRFQVCCTSTNRRPAVLSLHGYFAERRAVDVLCLIVCRGTAS